MAKCHVTATVNGDAVEFLCEPDETLLDVLRDQLHLTGSKEGCASGDCGACSVMLDDRLVCACLVLGAEAEGRSVETIEGMADGEELHPLQQKFLEHAALQCGVCTPGFIMSAKALLDRDPNPTEAVIRFQLAGNLCRCTGYTQIFEAVELVVAEAAGVAPAPRSWEARRDAPQPPQAPESSGGR
jgi:carbon-monoxide dehydrogenase small subunit